MGTLLGAHSGPARRPYFFPQKLEAFDEESFRVHRPEQRVLPASVLLRVTRLEALPRAILLHIILYLGIEDRRAGRPSHPPLLPRRGRARVVPRRRRLAAEAPRLSRRARRASRKDAAAATLKRSPPGGGPEAPSFPPPRCLFSLRIRRPIPSHAPRLSSPTLSPISYPLIPGCSWSGRRASTGPS